MNELSAKGFDAFLNSDYQKSRRLEMLKGVRHADCATCWNLETKGVRSPRSTVAEFEQQMERQIGTKVTLAQLTSAPSEDAPWLRSDQPVMLEIMLGNTCDMKCTYCNHHYSSQWAAERVKFGDIPADQVESEFSKPPISFANGFWEWFAHTGRQSLKYINLLGGEPLLMDGFYDFLDRLENFYPLSENPEVVLSIVSNFNASPARLERFLARIPRLKQRFQIDLNLSMESTGPRAEYIRHGLDWSRWELNVRRLLASEIDGVQISFQLATNALNVTSIEGFLRFAKALYDEYRTPIFLRQNIISDPHWQSPLILTPDFAEYLDRACDFLQSVEPEMASLNHPWGSWSAYRGFLGGIARRIREGGENGEARRKFFSWFSQYDQRRGLNFLETFPEYQTFWELTRTLQSPPTLGAAEKKDSLNTPSPKTEIENVAPEYFRLEHHNKEHENFVVVNWCIGNTCNYSCSYCPKDLHDGSKPWYDLEVAKSFCQRVIDHFAGRKVYFELTGGEVTAWKHLPELCGFLKERGSRIGIISNGSRSLEFWKQLAPLLDHVCLSYHPEAARTEHFSNVVRFVSQHLRTHVNIMMSPDDFDRCFAAAEMIKNIPNISMALQPLVVDFGDQLFKYTPEQMDVINRQNELIIRKIPHDRTFESYRGAMAMVTAKNQRIAKAPQRFISKGDNNWAGWRCFAGVEQIVVDMHGNIFRGWCQVGGQIGHVTDPNLRLPMEPVICTKTMCHCNFDIMATKEKIRPQVPQRLNMQPSGGI